jgi:HEPN domain-containing protein
VKHSTTVWCCKAERNPVVDEWISKAEGDWRAMELFHHQPGHEDAVVFHAQQCLEKYFKAALIAHGESGSPREA